MPSGCLDNGLKPRSRCRLLYPLSRFYRNLAILQVGGPLFQAPSAHNASASEAHAHKKLTLRKTPLALALCSRWECLDNGLKPRSRCRLLYPLSRFYRNLAILLVSGPLFQALSVHNASASEAHAHKKLALHETPLALVLFSV